jgi:uncharacterized membrane protein YkvA (DUF1232 family)
VVSDVGEQIMWWQLAVGVLVGLLLIWLGLVVALYLVGRRHGDMVGYKDVLRLVPDVLRLVRRLAADPTLPRGVRIRLTVLAVYLVLPVDVVPDFIPIVGYADDAIIVALVLRSVTRSAGAEALDRHWPGTPEGLRAVKRLAGVKP